MFVYSGINLGAALAPLVAGSLHRREGYEAGFLSAAFGMAVCLMTYQGLQWVITDSLRRKGTHRGGLGTRGFRGGAGDDVFDDFDADGAVRSRRGNRGVGGSNPTGRKKFGKQLRREANAALGRMGFKTVQCDRAECVYWNCNHCPSLDGERPTSLISASNT